MLFVVYEFTRRSKSILVDVIHVVWQQSWYAYIYGFNLTSAQFCWWFYATVCFAESSIAIKHNLSERALFKADHPAFKHETRKTKYTSGLRSVSKQFANSLVLEIRNFTQRLQTLPYWTQPR